MILASFGAVTLVFDEWRDPSFLGILVANTGIGIAQEVRAKRALDRLALLVAPRATVVRDGPTRIVPAAEVVEGDLVAVQAGNQVVADGVLGSAVDLRLDESTLTGESEPESVPRAVDVLCPDKTGRLTEAALQDQMAVSAKDVDDLERQLGRYGANSSARNGSIEAFSGTYPCDGKAVLAEVPFNSRRK